MKTRLFVLMFIAALAPVSIATPVLSATLAQNEWDGVRIQEASMNHADFDQMSLQMAELRQEWNGETISTASLNYADLDQQSPQMTELRQALVKAHAERFGSSDDLMVGIQLTHSGRLARPHDNKRPEPRIVYHHPLLGPKLRITPY